MSIREKLKQLKSIGYKEVNLLSLFELARYNYYMQHITGIEKLLLKTDIPLPSKKLFAEHEKSLSRILKGENAKWDDTSFHLKYRITQLEELLELKPELLARKKTIANVLQNKGYLLSILPLNLLMPQEVLENFLPPPDYSEPHSTKHIDPYGIFRKKSKVIDERTGLLLGTRKFRHSVLMNIHGFCPIGCSDCYKAYYTREEHELGVTLETLPRQTEAIVEWMNSNPEIYDIILSGGEPLMASNSAVAHMLKRFEKAKHLKVLRICTGVIFLGLPMRIDDELIDTLKDFAEQTGVVIRFHANLYNHFQITPEAVQAIKRIRSREFNVYSQVPIKEGINFFCHDENKTLDFLTKLCLLQVMIGVEPYKFIVDMHPRTNAYYVPIELLIRVWSRFAESHNLPESERPKTLSVLFKQGNIILSGPILFSAQKEVDKSRKLVRYYIPTLFNRKKMFVYEEPLLQSNS